MAQVALGLPQKRLGKWTAARIEYGGCAFRSKLLSNLVKGDFHAVLIRDINLVANSGASVIFDL